jgi:ribonuclease HI
MDRLGVERRPGLSRAVTADPAAEVVELELSLLRHAVRTDRRRLEALLHPDFVEVGASGRRWIRGELIEAMVTEPDQGAPEVRDIAGRVVDRDTVLVTYTTCRDGRPTHRSSMWVRRDSRWTVLHHQGTPALEPG